MFGLAILGFNLALVAVAWFLDRRRPASPKTRWDDPGESEAFAAAMLSKLRPGSGTGKS